MLGYLLFGKILLRVVNATDLFVLFVLLVYYFFFKKVNWGITYITHISIYFKCKISWCGATFIDLWNYHYHLVLKHFHEAITPNSTSLQPLGTTNTISVSIHLPILWSHTICGLLHLALVIHALACISISCSVNFQI